MKNSSHNFLRYFMVVISFLICVKAGAQTTSGNPIVDARILATVIAGGASQKQAILNIINANSPVHYNDYTSMINGLDPKLVTFLGLPPADAISAQIKSSAMNVNSRGVAQGTPLSPTDGIDALSSFIADRFKQEIEIAFLDSLRARISRVRELKSLFPTTYAVLQQNDPFQYTSFLETLKESLNKDVNNMPDDVGHFLETDPYHLAATKSWYMPTLIVYQDLLNIVKGQSVVSVLDTLNTGSLFKSIKGDTTYNPYLRMVAVFSRLLTNPDAPTTWLTTKAIAADLGQDDFKAFCGLLLIKEKAELQKITFDNQSLYGLILTKYDLNKFTGLYNWMIDVDQSLTQLLASYSNMTLQYKANKPISGSQVIDCGNALVASVDTVFLGFPFASVGVNLSPAIKKIQTDFSANANNIMVLVNIAADVKDKNYGLALVSGVNGMINYLQTTNITPKTLDLINKYGNFAVAVATAQSSADMETALSSAALPAGSYRIKRNSFFDISLNAYAGVFGGVESFSGSVPSNVKSSSASAGFTAPVGLTFSWGSTKNDKLTGSSYTLFLSVLDVGAVTSFRLTHDAASTLPNLTWGNVIAPGGYFVYGFKNSPLSLGFGAQYGPQLSSVSTASAVTLPSAWSARVFLAVDIPVFSFFTKTEN